MATCVGLHVAVHNTVVTTRAGWQSLASSCPLPGIAHLHCLHIFFPCKVFSPLTVQVLLNCKGSLSLSAGVIAATAVRMASLSVRGTIK